MNVQTNVKNIKYTIFTTERRQQGHVGSKTLHQQNSPVLNWRCRLTHVDLYDGRETVVVLLLLLLQRVNLASNAAAQHIQMILTRE